MPGSSALRVTIAIVAVLTFHVWLVGAHYVPAFAGSDQNGYLLLARRFAETGDAAKYTSDPYEFVSVSQVQVGDGVYYGKYPSGYPSLCVLAYWIGGPTAMFLVSPILATLAVLGLFLLGRALLGDFAGIAAAILLATNPVVDSQALSASSHAAAICFATWSMFFLWRWSCRGGWSSALLAGGLGACAASVRYTEALLALPFLALIVWRFRECEPAARKRVVQEAMAMTAAALVAIAPLLAHHSIAYGSPFATGYGLSEESTAFGWKQFQENWWLMLSRMESWLVLVFPVGLVGLATLAVQRPRAGVFLGSWLVPSLLLYTTYSWAPKGEGMGYVRFFVSVFPPLIIGALALLWSAVPSHARTALVGLFVLLASSTGLHHALAEMRDCTERLTESKEVVDKVRGSMPRDAAIFATAEVLDYLEFYGDYTLYAQGLFDGGSLARSQAVLDTEDTRQFQRERAREIVESLGDKNDAQLLELQRRLLNDLKRDGRTVALITNANGARRWRGRVGDEYEFVPRAVWASSSTDRQGNDRVDEEWVYQLVPRETLAARGQTADPKTRIELLRERARLLRAEYEARFPGAIQEWAAITELDQEVQNLVEELRRARAMAREESKPTSCGADAGSKP